METTSRTCPHCDATTSVEANVDHSFCSWCGEDLDAPPRRQFESPPRDEAVELSVAPAVQTDFASAPLMEAATSADRTCARCGDFVADGTEKMATGRIYCGRCFGPVIVGERDLRFESEFRGFGIMNYLSCAFALLFLVVGVPVALALQTPAQTSLGIPAGAYLAMVAGAGVALAVFSAFYFVWARGLRQFRNWSRIVGIVLYAFATVGAFVLILFGNIFQIIALPIDLLLLWFFASARSKRVTSPEYQSLIALNPGAKRPFPIILGIWLGIMGFELLVGAGGILLWIIFAQ